MHFLSCAGELNHHGRFMCDAMYNLLGNDYKRITTSFVNKTRTELGYRDSNALTYNINGSNFSEKEVKEWVSWADVIDYGAAPELFLHEAVKQNKVVFIRTERLLKEGDWKLFFPSVIAKYNRKYIQYRNNSKVYYLCIGQYAARDLNKIRVSNERVLQWAYCPEFIEYDDLSRENDSGGVLKLLWSGRLISWKHPEIAIEIAKHLHDRNILFNLEIAGLGELSSKLTKLIENSKLTHCVKLIGAIPANDMRKVMRKKDIFITTSDRNEGWGVVINEAMNSGCAVVASKDMGAAPMLINDGYNGFLFSLNKIKEAVDAIEKMYDNREFLKKIQINGYLTIKKSFTPDRYAEVFIDIANEALNGRVCDRSGIGQKALV